MLKAAQDSRISIGINAYSNTPRTAAPFDELQLTAADLQEKLHALREHGVFSIVMSEATRAHLHELARNGPWMSRTPFGADESLSLVDTHFADKLTAFAARVIDSIGGDNNRTDALCPNEIELRRKSHGEPTLISSGGAAIWHTDGSQLSLSCVSTLIGKPTEFVSPEVAERTALREKAFQIEASEGLVKEHEIQRAAPDCFIFFASQGLRGNIPKLVHRAPEDDGNRTIFIARWKSIDPPVEQPTKTGRSQTTSTFYPDLRPKTLEAGMWANTAPKE